VSEVGRNVRGVVPAQKEAAGTTPGSELLRSKGRPCGLHGGNRNLNFPHFRPSSSFE